MILALQARLVCFALLARGCETMAIGERRRDDARRSQGERIAGGMGARSWPFRPGWYVSRRWRGDARPWQLGNGAETMPGDPGESVPHKRGRLFAINNTGRGLKGKGGARNSEGEGVQWRQERRGTLRERGLGGRNGGTV